MRRLAIGIILALSTIIACASTSGGDTACQVMTDAGADGAVDPCPQSGGW